MKMHLARGCARTLGLAIGLAVLACVIGTEVSSAAVPPEGINCVASDGKISGRGATDQELAQKAFISAYREDFCGNVAEQFSGDPAGDNMVAYNYPAAVEHSDTGSGAGQKAASCRTDAFAGDSLPYTEAQLVELDGTPGKLGGCELPFEPPFQPKPSPFPNSGDHEAKVMTLPVAGEAVAIVVHLTAEDCGGTAPTSLNFTPEEVSRIFGGNATSWNDSELKETDPSLANCAKPITRVVREDNSQDTGNLKSYLVKVDNERSGAACAPAHKWSSYTASPNTTWPTTSEGGTCSELIKPTKSGGPEEIAKVKATDASVGYAALSDASGSGLIIADVRNATNTSFQPPNISKTANCVFTTLSLPGINAEESVGLNLEDNWSTNNEAPKSEGGNEEPNHENASDLGSKYPICGLAFVLVYTQDESSSNSQVAIKRLTADQRRTLYSYITFILSSAAQDLLSEDNFAPLPSSWIKTLREGFQANF